MLHSSETWVVTIENMHTLERNETNMLGWTCNASVHIQQGVSISGEKFGHKRWCVRETTMLVLACDAYGQGELCKEMLVSSYGGIMW